jgi:hypothetical protein
VERQDPVGPDGGVRFDAAADDAREVAMVAAAIRAGPVAAIVLGGSHDLSAQVLRQGEGRVKYIRVKTARYVQFAGDAAR